MVCTSLPVLVCDQLQDVVLSLSFEKASVEGKIAADHITHPMENTLNTTNILNRLVDFVAKLLTLFGNTREVALRHEHLPQLFLVQLPATQERHVQMYRGL